MKMMKKYIRMMLPFLLLGALLLVSCEEFNPAVQRPGHRPSESESETQPVVTDAEGNVDENPFTVSLVYEDQVYIPSADQPVTVQWSDGFTLYTAPIGSDGVARVGGLDGDYRVTLLNIPEGYGYNPNIYTATNRDREIRIELYKLVETTGHGDRLYDAIVIKNTGVYCLELTSPTQEIFMQFEPSKSGEYAVESWMDITANAINPIAKYYGANPAYKELQDTVDDGGISGIYTKNFRLIVQIADENIGQNMQPAFTFGLMGTSTEDQYPVKLYFAITLDGEFSLNIIQSTLMIPQEPLNFQQEYDPSLYEFVGAEFSQTVNGNTANVFDGKNYKLWPKSEGGDNYYHLYDETKYSSTNGYGPILYAKISSPCRFMAEPFTLLEYQGNKALTVSNATENYKLFIEGYRALNSYTLSPDNPNGIPPYFCTLDCPCRKEGTNDSIQITGEPGACITGCEKCHPDCRNIPEEAIGKKGYGDYTNSDGCYAVTQELKEFLQKYSISQWLFFDGNGFVETHPTVKVFAAEDDQWLFACGYYREK